MNRIEETNAILQQAIATHKPSLLIVCYSGGYDSMIVTHLVTRWARTYAHSTNLLVAAVDTLISADGWREYVTQSARSIGVRRFEIWNNPDLTRWTNDVIERGFVYRKAQHPFYFYYLKQRAFRAMQAHYKKHRHDRIMFLNGIRREESPERADAPEVEEKGAGVFVNPILYWHEADVHSYRVAHDLPVNPFYDRFGNSGDCLCNWHNRISMDAVRAHAKQAASIIEPLHRHNLEHFHYGYDEEPAQWRKQEASGQLRLFDWDTDCTPNLCAGCQKPEPRNADLDFVLSQRMEW